MKHNPKLIVFHQSPQKPVLATQRLILLTTFLTLTTFTFLLTLLKPTPHPNPNPNPNPTLPKGLPQSVSSALLKYAGTSSNGNSNSNGNNMTMSLAEVNCVGDIVVKQCGDKCKMLVFGFSHESLLWHSLNYGDQRRSVFLDENVWLVENYERNFSDFEAYDVQYTTKVSQWKEMIKDARLHRKDDCKPVQNLLFSDCKLAINDLPNHLYDIPWDIILIDGPRGYSRDMPGRMAAIFTAAVMARTPTREQERERETHVFVHDYRREIERKYSEEFLCKENLVGVIDNLAHFVVKQNHVGSIDFCKGRS